MTRLPLIALLTGLALMAGCSHRPSDAAPAAAATAASAADQAADHWMARIWPEHQRSIADAQAIAHRHAGGTPATPLAQALLQRAATPLPLGELEGSWQVRSIQIHDSFGYAYPWFDATLLPDADGTLRLAKTTGSQRRTGLLLPMDAGTRLAFLGASTVNDDPTRRYSRSAGAAAPSEHDSVGQLVRIGPQELLLVLDASARGFELYHLRR